MASAAGTRKANLHLTARQNARLRARIAARRAELNMSERGLSLAAGVSISAVRAIGARGDSAGPTLAVLLALAEALQLASLDDLLGTSSSGLFRDMDAVDTALAANNPIAVRVALGW